MNKILRLLYGVSSFIILSCMYSSCSDDSEDILDITSSDEEIIDAVLNMASTSWNSTVEQIKHHMNGYTLVDSDENFLQYIDKSGLVTISYTFSNDCLMATATIVPKLSETDLSSSLQGYNYLGDLSSKHIYYSESLNTMCFSYNTSDNNADYTVLGFTPITSELYPTVELIYVESGNPINIGSTYVTITGFVSGVTKKCTCGVRYSTDFEFPTYSSKTTTSNGDFSIKISGLQKNTRYYYQCYTIVDGITYYGGTRGFMTLQ